MAAGLVKEIKAKPGVAIWRRGDETGQSFALKLTTAGLKAIAVDDKGDAPPTTPGHFERPMIDDGKDAQTARSQATSTVALRQGTKMRGSSACCSERTARRWPN